MSTDSHIRLLTTIATSDGEPTSTTQLGVWLDDTKNQWYVAKLKSTLSVKCKGQ